MADRIHDLFGPGSNVGRRVVRDYEEIAKIADHCRGLGLRIVITSGTFDMLHVGHSRYLEEAKKRGDVLMVGVDSDEKTRDRKGPSRPFVPEDERLEILCHLRHVDMVFLKGLSDPKWELIRRVNPDVLIVSQGEHPEEEFTQLRKLCLKVVVLPRQAETSTTARVRKVMLELAQRVRIQLHAAFEETERLLNELTGGEG